MEKKMIKKLLAIMMIITILATDFFVLGSGLISYAAQLNNEIEGYPNIYFSTYFKEGENEVKQVNKSIKDKDLKLYAKIGVNSNVDYLEDIQIELKNSNFNIISSKQGSREGNIVKLDYIGAGSSVEIELDIEPILSNKISADMLLKTNVELTAKYKHADAPEGETIKATSESSVKYQPDEATEAELETKIITNKVLAVNGENKKIIQLLIKSRLANNEYPVEQTTLNVSIPQLSEEVEEVNVMAIGQLATNGLTEISSDNYTVDGDKLQIILKNEVDTNNEISWVKDAYDELVVTFIYPEIISSTHISTGVNSEIKVYESTETYTKIMANGLNGLEQPNSVIMGRTEITTEEMYKGKLYANLDAEYNTKTKLIVTKENIVDEIKVGEGPDAFGTAESELLANTKYITTEINLNKMLKILGTDGILTIKNGNTITTINKDTAVDEKGNVVINHENGTSILEITTSKPEKAGVLEINHTKAITGNTYTREQLKTVKALNVKNTTSATLEGTEIVKESTGTKTLELKETISKAELTIENNKETLSTTEANEITLGITLITDGTQYDLYKNPEITIQMPEVVENVEFAKPTKQNADEFEISANYDSNTKIYKINLLGEQTTYPKSALTQGYLQLNLNVTLERLAISQTDKITMTYKNENASQYAGGTTDVGIVEKTIQIEAPSQVITMFNLSLNENTSLTESILQRIQNEDAGKTLDFKIGLVNNEDSEIKNVKIFGKLPTTGNTITEQEVNTLETILKNITAENATVYYTENINATTDIADATNGWTTDLGLLTNAKLYLIKLDSLSKTAYYTAEVTVQIPNPITQSAISYTEYEVIYDTDSETNVKESSRKIGLISSLAATLTTGITAQVGQDNLNSGDTVKEGEVIKYTVKVKNDGTQTLNDIKLSAEVPEGTVLVKPIEGAYTLEDGTVEDDGYVYIKNAYYEEITNSEKIAEITSRTISELAPGVITEMQYEVRVNKGSAGTEISNKATVMSDGSTKESAEFKNKISESNIRVTIKRTIDEKIQLFAGGTTRYTVYVENLSNSTINNLEMQILSDVFNVESIENDEIFLYGKEIPEKISITELEPNEIMYFSIYGSIDNDVKEMNTSIVVNDANGNRYRSNALTEVFPTTGATITLTSPQNGSYIKENDLVEYNIIVKNTGDIEGNVTIEDVIPEFLQVQSISINGNIVQQCIDETNADTYIEKISNNILDGTALKPGETAQIDIITKVGYISKLYHGKVITNYAKVEVFDILENNSQMVSHILQANLMQDEDVKNVINGLAWFDENENGQRDGNEKVLPEINVKIYDLLTNNYLKDDSGNFVETRTDSNGEYTFTKINNGSYLIVFEYDTKTYELTTGFAEGVDTSINSKVTLRNINVNGKEITVPAIEINGLEGNIFNMNIGLKENLTPEDDQITPEEPEIPENPETPEEPEKPENPENPETPEIPENPEKPEKPENPEEPETPEEPEEDKKTISGLAWLDSNRNGQKDIEDIVLSGIKVRLYDVSTKNYLAETITDSNGKYTFSDIEKGSYILIFEYDTEKYEPTTYCAEGVDTTVNSKVVLKKINVNGQEITAAVTDTIKVQDDVSNINIGLKEKLTFDLELNKYISRIVVQTSQGTKSYNYEKDTFEKVEIHRKQIQGALVVLEYTIEIRNTGEMSGYAKNIVDYLPSGLTFSSELNSDWYLSENYLYTKSLEKAQLDPGEEKEIKLILTKTMTSENVGLINNRAEIYQDYNKYGDADIDSTPNNQAEGEDDIGSADVIIMVATGGGGSMLYIIVLMMNLVLIAIAIRLMFRNKIIKLPAKKKGRR